MFHQFGKEPHEFVGRQEEADAGKPQTAAATSGFTLLDEVSAEPPAWQVRDLLRKAGVTLLVAPSGACTFALCAYFAALLTGRVCAPLGAARYPGDVMFSTYTTHLDRSLRAALMSLVPTEHKVLTRVTQRPFNWKNPAEALDQAFTTERPRKPAAVIIDAGSVSRALRDTTVEDAFETMARVATQKKCSILLVIESNSRNPDPYERIPKPFRHIRGTLLAVPLRSKALVPDPGTPAEFLLMRLPEAAPNALTLRFCLLPVLDPVETLDIRWGELSYQDPREAFRRAETLDLSEGQRVAVQLAAEIIREHGPTSSKDLQAACKSRHGLAPTTVRESLSMARLYGYLDKARNYDGRWFWVIPGVTRLPFGMTLSSGLTEEQIPF